MSGLTKRGKKSNEEVIKVEFSRRNKIREAAFQIFQNKKETKFLTTKFLKEKTIGEK